jgi:hypothetical protein
MKMSIFKDPTVIAVQENRQFWKPYETRNYNYVKIMGLLVLMDFR